MALNFSSRERRFGNSDNGCGTPGGTPGSRLCTGPVTSRGIWAPRSECKKKRTRRNGERRLQESANDYCRAPPGRQGLISQFSCFWARDGSGTIKCGLRNLDTTSLKHFYALKGKGPERACSPGFVLALFDTLLGNCGLVAPIQSRWISSPKPLPRPIQDRAFARMISLGKRFGCCPFNLNCACVKPSTRKFFVWTPRVVRKHGLWYCWQASRRRK